MSKPGKGRPFKKDITYTDASKITDDINKKPFKPATGGMDEVARTPAPVRPYTNG
jgi:hypothetical protein